MRIEDVRIGASDVAPALGLSSYETPYEWSLRKMGRHPDDEEDERSEASRLGTFLEDGLARMFADEHGVELDPLIDGSVSVAHPDVPWMQARPDRLVRFDGMTAEFRRRFDIEPGEHVLVEVKTSGLTGDVPRYVRDTKWGAPGTDVVPIEYAAQTQQQMNVVDARERDSGHGFVRRTIVVALIGGIGKREYMINADLKVRGHITGELSRIVRDHLVPEVPLPATTRDDYELMIKATRQPGSAEKIVVKTTADFDALVADWRYNREMSEMHDADASRAKAAIIEWIGERYGVEGPWGKLLYTVGGVRESVATRKVVNDAIALMTAESKGEDYKRAQLAKAFLDIVKRHTKKSTTGRALRPYFKEQGK
jgi:hypothetical protein